MAFSSGNGGTTNLDFSQEQVLKQFIFSECSSQNQSKASK